jgi:hypothetical protein
MTSAVADRLIGYYEAGHKESIGPEGPYWMVVVPEAFQYKEKEAA